MKAWGTCNYVHQLPLDYAIIWKYLVFSLFDIPTLSAAGFCFIHCGSHCTAFLLEVDSKFNLE